MLVPTVTILKSWYAQPGGHLLSEEERHHALVPRSAREKEGGRPVPWPAHVRPGAPLEKLLNGSLMPGGGGEMHRTVAGIEVAAPPLLARALAHALDEGIKRGQGRVLAEILLAEDHRDHAADLEPSPLDPIDLRAAHSSVLVDDWRHRAVCSRVGW